ncbi:MAG TPA: hypothetical protein VGF01_15155 [Terracidiphilus sp.]|jgi:hypothetical protein
MRNRIFLVSALFVTSLLCSAQSSSIAGEWRGIWSDSSGYGFTATITLVTGSNCKACASSGDGSVQGTIIWTMRKVPAKATAEEAAKVGMTATEYVRGERKGVGLLVLNGYKKDDPNSIFSLDRYRLAISDDGLVLGGITFDNGSWTGQLMALRAQN